jgi:hypothetical protein
MTIKPSWYGIEFIGLSMSPIIDLESYYIMTVRYPLNSLALCYPKTKRGVSIL